MVFSSIDILGGKSNVRKWDCLGNFQPLWWNEDQLIKSRRRIKVTDFFFHFLYKFTIFFINKILKKVTVAFCTDFHTILQYISWLLVFCEGTLWSWSQITGWTICYCHIWASRSWKTHAMPKTVVILLMWRPFS